MEVPAHWQIAMPLLILKLENFGGLFGGFSGTNGSCTITNSYANIDTLSGNLAGSIAGLGSVNIATVYVPSGTNAIGGDATPLTGVIYDLAPITGSVEHYHLNFETN